MRAHQRRKKETAEEAEVLGNKPSQIDIERPRRTRSYIRPTKAFQPFLEPWEKEAHNGQVRISRANMRMMQMAEESQETMEEFISRLSAEELVRGQPKAVDGTFRGRPPKWIPRAFHRACIAELMRRGKQMWQINYLDAIEAMTEIARGTGAGKHATPGERLKAAQFIIERLEGKIPDRVIISDEQPWMLVLDDIVGEISDSQVIRGRKMLDSAQELKQEILDAEIVDVEEDLDAGLADEEQQVEQPKYEENHPQPVPVPDNGRGRGHVKYHRRKR